MKKYAIILLAVTALTSKSNAQNTFPSSGPAGIGTSTPVSPLHMYCAQQYYNGAPVNSVSSFRIENIWWNQITATPPVWDPYIIEVWSKGLSAAVGNPTILANTKFFSIGAKTGLVDVGTNLNVGNNGTINGDLSVIKNGLINIDLTVNNNASIKKNLTVDVDATVKNDLNVTKNGTFGTNVTVNGNHYVKGITVLGNTSINTPSGYKLYVDQGILTTKIKVTGLNSADWMDMVFDEEYKLRSLHDVETFIKEYKHLPEIPSAKDVEKNGLDLAKMDARLLQKIEELTLYTIQLQKQIDLQKKEMDDLKKVR